MPAIPGLTDKGVARTATLADAARLLPPGTALLEYVVQRVGGQEPLDQTVLFVVTREGKARSPRARAYRLPIGRKTLVAEVDALRRSCADPRKPYSTRARSLYRRLAGVADKQLAGVKRLLICPDDVLWDVPFAALHDGKRFLLERCEIAYAYSATGAQAALSAGANPRHRRVRATRTLLALANPDFGNEKRFGDDPAVPGQRPVDSPSRPLDTPSRPVDSPSRPLDSPSRPLMRPADRWTPPHGRWTRRPAPFCCRAAGASCRCRERSGKRTPSGNASEARPSTTAGSAQESVVKREAGRYRYVHLASHAFFNDAAPLLSSVVLASPPAGSPEDGFLTAREIFDLDLSAAEMVVLSACNTARGEKRSGEGIVGLTWALFVAGAPTQVLCQWAVDDASTATLMQRFYANLTGQGQTAKGAALRRAALTLLRDGGRHRHPYYWAPFVLIGDWR
jgi:CHAT domain-containing protein